MTPSQVAQSLRHLHAAYGTEVTQDMATLWANTFAGDEVELFRDAVAEWIKERSEFPTPAGLRQVMREVMRRQQNLPELQPAGTLVIAGPEGGFKIAYDSYCREVTKQGREPKTFDEFVGRMPVSLR